MDKGPLVDEEIAAAACFLGEFTKSYPVQFAFWLKEGEHHNWKLYIVSEQITDENFDEAYGEVVRITGEIRDPWFNGMQVSVLGVDERLAKAVAELRRRYPADKLARFFGETVDGIEAEEIYVYPSLMPTVRVAVADRFQTVQKISGIHPHGPPPLKA